MGSHIKKDTKSISIFQFNSTQPEVKYLVIATISSSNMKSFAMGSFVFFIVAITMIAMAKGGITGVCKEWLDEIAECSKGTKLRHVAENKEFLIFVLAIVKLNNLLSNITKNQRK